MVRSLWEQFITNQYPVYFSPWFAWQRRRILIISGEVACGCRMQSPVLATLDPSSLTMHEYAFVEPGCIPCFHERSAWCSILPTFARVIQPHPAGSAPDWSRRFGVFFLLQGTAAPPKRLPAPTRRPIYEGKTLSKLPARCAATVTSSTGGTPRTTVRVSPRTIIRWYTLVTLRWALVKLLNK